MHPLSSTSSNSCRNLRKKLLEVASVAGETFTTAALAAGLQADAEQVDAGCEELVRLGSLISELNLVIWPDGTPSASYRFQHALYRQVIYERLGQGHRVRLHRILGERLVTGYRARVGEIAGELALHFNEGRDEERAVHYYQLAAKSGAGRGALHEVLTHCRAGLRLLGTLPATPRTIPWELDLLLLLGTTLIAAEGHASIAVIDTYTRAETLCRQIGDNRRLILVLLALRAYHFVRGDMHVAGEYSQQLLELARQQQTPLLLTAAHLAMGNSLLFSGALTRACEYLDLSACPYDPQLHQEYITTFGADAGVVCYIYRAWALNLLGYPEQARRANRAGLTLARERAHPFSLALALGFAIIDCHFHGDLEKLAQYVDESIMYCEQQGLANLADHAHIFQHWLHAKQGELSAGTDRLEQALNKIRASGSRLRTPYFFSLLIDVYSDARRYAEARQILQQNLAEVMDTGMYIYRPELLRLQGELLLAERPGQTAAAERSFQEAIVASRQQQARALELRSTISLSRLWQMQGKRRQAVQVLKALYDQFSEGFDSVDLRMARSLLDSSDHCPQAFA